MDIGENRSDGAVRQAYARDLSRSVLLGAGVALAGGGALAAAWFGRDWSAAFRGWTSYRASVVGDTLLLPLLIATLHAAAARLKQTRTSSRTASRCLFAAGAAAVIGAGVQAQTLLSDNVELNWTLPAHHHFNAVGWWHATFFVGVCALLGALVTDVVTAFDARGAVQLRSANVVATSAIISFGALAFQVLAVADADGTNRTAQAAAFAALDAIVVVLLVRRLSAKGSGDRHGLRLLARGVSSGVAMAVAAVIVVTTGPLENALTALAAIAAVAVGVALAARTTLAPLAMVTFGAGAAITFLAGHQIVTETGTVQLGLAVIVAAFALAAMVVTLQRGLLAVAEPTWWRQPRDGLPAEDTFGSQLAASAVAAALMGIVAAASWLDLEGSHAFLTGGLLLTVTGALMGRALFPYFRVDFNRLVDAEETPDPDERAEALKRVSGPAAVRATAWPTAAVTALFAITLAAAPSLGFVEGDHIGHLSIADYIAFAAAAIAVVAATAVAVLRKRLTVAPAMWWLQITGSVIIGAVFFCGFVTAAGPWGARSVLALQSVVVAVWVFESVTGNVTLRPGRQVTRRVTLSAAAAAFAVTSAVLWACTAATWDRDGHIASLWTGLAWLVVAELAATSVMVILAVMLTRDDGTSDQTAAAFSGPPHQLASGLLLDTGMLALLVIALIWLPHQLLVHIPDGAHERYAAVASVLSGFLLFLSPPFFWILGNNVRHAHAQRLHQNLRSDQGRFVAPHWRRWSRRRLAHLKPSSPIQSKEAWCDLLDGHTSTQNLLALVLVASSLVGVIAYLNDLPEPND